MIAPEPGTVVPSAEEPPLATLVLTCGSPECRHVFAPPPAAFSGGRLRCPRCAGWTFTGELGTPTPSGGGS